MDGELLFFADKGGESNFKEMAEWSSDDEAEEEGEDAEKGGVDIREVMKGGDASDSGSESGDESE